MLIRAELHNSPAVNRLVKLWSSRYTPDVIALATNPDPDLRRAIAIAASPEGRAETVAKLHEKLLDTSCKLASIQAKDLYFYLPKVLDLKEAWNLSKFANQIYLQLLEFYQNAPLVECDSAEQFWAHISTPSISAWGIPKIDMLAQILEPLLLEFQQHYLLANDWRALAFITTQFNFTNELLLKELHLVERVLIQPYFNFVEEQVALPWQRVCAAAINHSVHSPEFALVEQMLPLSKQIAATVYEQLMVWFPTHRSRRGSLDHPGIKHSCLRDLNMFQAYLWLCVLQGSLEPIEQELVALCITVMEAVGVKWEVTAQWNMFLTQEILNRVTPKQYALLRPYCDGMIAAFLDRRSQFGAIA